MSTNSSGGQYPGADTSFQADTQKLRVCADRLSGICKRLKAIDERMEKLYARAGLRDLQTLVKEEAMLRQKKRIENCARYLSETADDLEQTERQVMSLF